MRRAWNRWKELTGRHRWLGWLQDVALALLVLAAVFAWQTRNLVPSGEQAPEFALRDLSGREWRSADLRGRPLVLHFWAPWCAVCAADSGALSSLARSGLDGAQVLSVAVAFQNVEDVRRFAREHGVDYPVLVGDDALMRSFRVDTFPTTYFISKEGRIRRATVGYTTWLGLRWRLWF